MMMGSLDSLARNKASLSDQTPRENLGHALDMYVSPLPSLPTFPVSEIGVAFNERKSRTENVISFILFLNTYRICLQQVDMYKASLSIQSMYTTSYFATNVIFARQ